MRIEIAFKFMDREDSSVRNYEVGVTRAPKVYDFAGTIQLFAEEFKFGYRLVMVPVLLVENQTLRYRTGEFGFAFGTGSLGPYYEGMAKVALMNLLEVAGS